MMITKKLISIIIAFIILLGAFTPIASSETSEITAKDFSKLLETFYQNNIQYAFSEAVTDESSSDYDVCLNRLVVSTYSNDKLENYCGAVDVLEGYNNWHLLQFDSVESTESAYEYYSCQEYVRYVEYEELITVDDVDEIESESIEDDYQNLSSRLFVVLNIFAPSLQADSGLHLSERHIKISCTQLIEQGGEAS